MGTLQFRKKNMKNLKYERENQMHDIYLEEQETSKKSC